jgi:hypothetical protein
MPIAHGLTQPKTNPNKANIVAQAYSLRTEAGCFGHIVYPHAETPGGKYLTISGDSDNLKPHKESVNDYTDVEKCQLKQEIGL